MTTTDKLTTWKQYIYVDHQLSTTSRMGVNVVKLRKWIDSLEAYWRTAADTTVTRVSLDELIIVAKSGAHLRIVNR